MKVCRIDVQITSRLLSLNRDTTILAWFDLYVAMLFTVIVAMLFTMIVAMLVAMIVAMLVIMLVEAMLCPMFACE